MTELLAQAGRLGWPDEPLRWLTLAAAAPAAWLLARWLGSRRGARWLVPGCALGAAMLSAAYIAYVLRGGPRIIDASSYWLQARALADGWLAFPLGEPEASVLGRFLVPTHGPVTLGGALASLLTTPAALGPTTATSSGAAVIFPPGYPAVLSVGFALGAPLAVGPALGAALVFATAALGASVERAFGTSHGYRGTSGLRGADRLPRLAHVAALFSVLSATLRYHTADTMSHGLAALCFTVGLAAAMRSRSSFGAGRVPAARRPTRTGPTSERGRRSPSFSRLLQGAAAPATIAGLALGWLFATRPVSALALATCIAYLWLLLPSTEPHARLATSRRWRARLGAVAAGVLGTLPGVLLWLAHQRAATGTAWGSAQMLYYSLSDGPAGCFRYGFGPSVGCLGEHGTFVRDNLSAGFGLLAAFGTTARRLQHHLADPLNFGPLFLLVLLGAWLGRRLPSVRCLALGVVAQTLAYAPFYFDGNYPGAGARMLADVLPLEHVLAAFAVIRLAQLAPAGTPSARGLLGAVLAAALGGFALQSGSDHAQLRERDGGRPMFEPAAVASVPRPALVLVDTDHGLNLGLRPGTLTDQTVSASDVMVLRHRGDGFDRLAWERLGRPATFRYVREPGEAPVPPDGRGGGALHARLEPLRFDEGPLEQQALRLEGESLWPAREQHAAWAWPQRGGAGGASGDGWLRVHAEGTASCPPHAGTPAVRISLPAAALAGRWLSARARWWTDDAAAPCARSDGEIAVVADSTAVHHWPLATAEADAGGAGWRELPPIALPAQLARLELVVRGPQQTELDYVSASALLP